MLSLEDMQQRRLESLRRYMVPGERVLTATHEHWAKLAEPVATATVGLVVVAWLDTSLTSSQSVVANVLWWAWFALVARMLWVFLDRQHTWFVSTDRRLLLTFGLVNQKVAMMPMAKVTDMSYNRSVLGRLFGYGTFVLESAGQDQALREIDLVPRPDYIYRTICAVMFGTSDNEDELAGTYEDPQGDRDASQGSGEKAKQTSGGKSRSGDQSKSEDQSGGADRGRKRSPAGDGSDGSADGSADGGEQEEAERRRVLREADTGPIPVQRPRRR